MFLQLDLKLLVILAGLIVELTVFVEGDHLVLVHAIWRHGDRTPLGTFPNDPHQKHWSQGFGKLTEKGKKQHNELGKWMRGRYVDHYKFLSHKYDSKNIHVQSSNIQRTIKSAKANILGMFKGKEPNVHTESSDPALLPMSACPRAVQLYKMIFGIPQVSEQIQKSKKLFDRLSKLTGKTQYFWKVNELADIIRVGKDNKLKIDKKLDSLWSQVKEQERQYFSNMFGHNLGEYKGQDFHVELPKALAGVLLKQIIERMKETAEGRARHKYFAVSAHDVTIMGLMATLGLNSYDYDRDSPPKYASALMIELWEKSGGGRHYVRAHYRSSSNPHHIDLSTKIGKCKDRGCSLDEFINQTKQFIPDNVNEFCSTPPNGYKE